MIDMCDNAEVARAAHFLGRQGHKKNLLIRVTGSR